MSCKQDLMTEFLRFVGFLSFRKTVCRKWKINIQPPYLSGLTVYTLELYIFYHLGPITLKVDVDITIAIFFFNLKLLIFYFLAYRTVIVHIRCSDLKYALSVRKLSKSIEVCMILLINILSTQPWITKKKPMALTTRTKCHFKVYYIIFINFFNFICHTHKKCTSLLF